MQIKTDAVGQIVARPEEARWVEHPWFEGNDEGDEDNDTGLSPTSLWEAEITALDDEKMQHLRECAEDD
jgi:hypothetical protein